MVARLVWAFVAGTTLLFAAAPGLPSGAGREIPDAREDTRGEHRDFRATHGRHHAPAEHRLPPNRWWWLPPAAPAAPDSGQPVVIIQQAPAAVEVVPPPPPSAEPAYVWSYCGPAGARPSQRTAAEYCIEGLRPSLRGLPGPGKTNEQFQADTATCQDWASAHAATLPGTHGSMQARYDAAYRQCLQAAGNEIAGGVVPGQAEQRPPPPVPRQMSLPRQPSRAPEDLPRY